MDKFKYYSFRDTIYRCKNEDIYTIEFFDGGNSGWNKAYPSMIFLRRITRDKARRRYYKAFVKRRK